MKKIMLSLAMALVSVCASAQVYIGGTAGISSNKIGDGDSKTAYTLMPEIGYQLGCPAPCSRFWLCFSNLAHCKSVN